MIGTSVPRFDNDLAEYVAYVQNRKKRDETNLSENKKVTSSLKVVDRREQSLARAVYSTVAYGNQPPRVVTYRAPVSSSRRCQIMRAKRFTSYYRVESLWRMARTERA